MPRLFTLLFTYLILNNLIYADVVKPALVQITVHTDERVNIKIRTSIEASLTGINGQYKNTQ